jgi:hypothetical protein
MKRWFYLLLVVLLLATNGAWYMYACRSPHASVPEKMAETAPSLIATSSTQPFKVGDFYMANIPIVYPCAPDWGTGGLRPTEMSFCTQAEILELMQCQLPPVTEQNRNKKFGLVVKELTGRDLVFIPPYAKDTDMTYEAFWALFPESQDRRLRNYLIGQIRDSLFYDASWIRLAGVDPDRAFKYLNLEGGTDWDGTGEEFAKRHQLYQGPYGMHQYVDAIIVTRHQIIITPVPRLMSE